jgi:hypothetical protein
MDKFLIKAFGAAITEYGTSSDKFETSNYKPGGTLCSALGPCDDLQDPITKGNNSAFNHV